MSQEPPVTTDVIRSEANVNSPNPKIVEPEVDPPETTLAQDIKAGLLGLAIAVGCLFLIVVPLVHFVAPPGGPGIGGFVASSRIRARGKHTAIIGFTIGGGEALAVASIAIALILFQKVGTDAFSLFMSVAAVVATLLYASTLGTIGAYLGGRKT